MCERELDTTFGKVQLALMLHNPWFAQNDSAIFTAIYHLEVGFAWQSLDEQSDKSTAMGGYSLLLKVEVEFNGLHFGFVLQCLED